MPTGIGPWVEVVGRREAPASRMSQEAVVPEVVVSVTGQDVEQDTPEELLKILTDGRWIAVELDRPRDVQVARHRMVTVPGQGHGRREQAALGSPTIEAPRSERVVRGQIRSQELCRRNGDARARGELVQQILPLREVPAIGRRRELGHPEV